MKLNQQMFHHKCLCFVYIVLQIFQLGKFFFIHFKIYLNIIYFRITASLQGGIQVPAPSAQIFYIEDNTDLDVVFPFLRQQKDYGRLCITEEPLVTGLSTMGRLISGMKLHKCYFSM